MLNKNILCVETKHDKFKENKIYTVEQIQDDFCVRSEDKSFYKVVEINYPNIIAKSLIFGDEVTFQFQN